LNYRDRSFSKTYRTRWNCPFKYCLSAVVVAATAGDDDIDDDDAEMRRLAVIDADR